MRPPLFTNIHHSLKPIDIVVLKKLSDVVNVVPVIAKSDSLTLEERLAFKERIKEEFTFHNLKMYPYDNDELDDEERAVNAQIKVLPFLPPHIYIYIPALATSRLSILP